MPPARRSTDFAGSSVDELEATSELVRVVSIPPAAAAISPMTRTARVLPEWRASGDDGLACPADDLVDGLGDRQLRGVDPQADPGGLLVQDAVERLGRPPVVGVLRAPGLPLLDRGEPRGEDHDVQGAGADRGHQLGELAAEHHVLRHGREPGLRVGVAGAGREDMAQAQLAQRFRPGVRAHVDPAVDDPPAELVAVDVDGRAVEPLGERLGDGGLPRGLDAGHEMDAHPAMMADGPPAQSPESPPESPESSEESSDESPPESPPARRSALPDRVSARQGVWERSGAGEQAKPWNLSAGGADDATVGDRVRVVGAAQAHDSRAPSARLAGTERATRGHRACDSRGAMRWSGSSAAASLARMPG